MSVWDGDSPYASEREWADAQIRRLKWRNVCLSPLGTNLAVAGALCAAHRDGWVSRIAFVRAIETRAAIPVWHPGCGWETPR